MENKVKDDAAFRDFLKSKVRLRMAINDTIAMWPYVDRCWVDQISEPTVMLQKHALKPEVQLGEE